MENKNKELHSLQNFLRKTTRIIIPIISLIAIEIGFTSCPDDKEDDTVNSSVLGMQAAKETCECLDNGKSKQTCEDELNEKYKYKIDKDFIAAFNKAGYCDITINPK